MSDATHNYDELSDTLYVSFAPGEKATGSDLIVGAGQTGQASGIHHDLVSRLPRPSPTAPTTTSLTLTRPLY
jgi:hypothetical protein